MNPNKREYGFELFGIDLMIDDNFKVWLIEVNTNPCLALSSPLLVRLLPSLIENVFRIAVDPIFNPPNYQEWNINKKHLVPDNLIENNRFELIFDELSDG